jgi:signal transduction histidine kinase
MRTLQHKIALFLGLSSFLTLLAGVTLCMRIYERTVRDQSAKAQVAVSRSIPNAIQALQAEMQDRCQAIAGSPEIISAVRNHDPWGLMACLARFMTPHQFDFAEVTRPNGEVILDLSDTTAVSQLTGNPLILQAQTDSQTVGILRSHEDVYLAAATPIVVGDNLMGVLSIGQSFGQDILHYLGRGQSELLAIWKTPEGPSYVIAGRPAMPPLTTILTPEEHARLDSGAFVTKVVKAKGYALQATIFKLDVDSGGPGAYLAVYHSVNFLIEAGLWARFHLLTVSIFIILLMFIFAWWTSRRIAEPLAKLTQATRRLAALDFSERVPVSGRDEIADLASSFNHLAAELQRNIAQKDAYAEQLADLNDNLEHLVAARTEELVNANLRLKHAAVEKEDLLRAVSHDLGAPLRNIAGLAHLLEQKHSSQLGPEGLEKLSRIGHNVRHDLQMIDQLLDISRIKTRRGGATRIDLNELLAQIREDFSFQLEEHNIRLTVNDVLPVIFADRIRVRQLFQNLIDNGIKYLGNQPLPAIEIGWTEEEKIYLFWVSDNGMGIAPDQQDKVFGIFRRVKSPQTAHIEGKGVGLAVVKSIVEMMGGEIWVESIPQAGSTFYLTMDRSLVDGPASSDAALPAPAEGMALLV